MQDLYFDNYKALLEEIKEDLQEWKIFRSCLRVGSLKIVHMALLPKLLYTFNTVALKKKKKKKKQQKISWLWAEIDEVVLKIMWKFRIGRTMWRKNRKQREVCVL